MSYTSQTNINEAKRNLSHMDFIKQFAQEKLEPADNFTESARRHMFAHWVRGEDEEFQTLRNAFRALVMNTEENQRQFNATAIKPIPINPLDVQGIIERKTFGSALQRVKYNNTWSYYVIPEVAQLAIFSNWTDFPLVVRLLGTYIRDINIPAYVLNDERVILILVPPLPPKRGQPAYYTYIPNREWVVQERSFDFTTNPFQSAASTSTCSPTPMPCALSPASMTNYWVGST